MVSKINLPTINPKEQAAVTSSAVDVFYVPKKRPPSSIVGDIARSLNSIIPALQQYDDVKEQIEISDQEAKADKDFMENNKTDFKELVKNGTIKEGANPYYVKRYVKNHLRETARTFETELYEAYRKNGLDTNINPSAFTEFYKGFAADFRDKNNLGAYDAQSLSEGFIPYAEATRSNLNNRFIQERITNIENNQIATLNNFVEGNLITSLNIEEEDLDRALVNYNIEGLTYQEKDVLYQARLIQDYADALIDDGMDATTANKTVVDAVINAAKLQHDEDVLFILDNIITDKNSGARLAGSYKSEIADAQLAIADLKLAKIRDIEYTKGLAEQERKEAILNHFIRNPLLLKDVTASIKEFNFLITVPSEQGGVALPNGDIAGITADEAASLIQLSNAYMSSLNRENIITTEFSTAYRKDIDTLLATDPNNPALFRKIRDGQGIYYTYDEMVSYFDKYFSRKNVNGTMYTNDKRYAQVFGELDATIATQVKTQGVIGVDMAELKEDGEVLLLDLFYETVESLDDPKYVEKFALINDNEKKKHLFGIMRAEVDRILEIILPRDKRFKLDETEDTAAKKAELYKIYED